MDRQKFYAVLVALMAGVILSAGRVWALAPVQISGYLMGDPAPGKLVPYFKVSSTLSTLIGIESVEEDKAVEFNEGEDVLVHVTVFDTGSVEKVNFELCLSPFDFGFVVLQKANALLNPAQVAELNKVIVTPSHVTTRGSQPKIKYLSTDTGDIPSEGYVTLRATKEFFTHDGTCGQGFSDQVEEDIPDGVSEPLATWAILADVGSGFFATEIPTPTAVVLGQGILGDTQAPIRGKGAALGGVGAYGLIPSGNAVIARFDVNPTVGSHTDIYVWLANNGHGSVPATLECEDELAVSTSIPVPREVNVIDPDTLSGIWLCKADRQFRGVLEFFLPDTGFLFSHISQDDAHFRENFLGYNLECNTFIDPDCDDPCTDRPGFCL